MELNKGHIAFAVACFVAGGIIGAGLKSCSTPKQPAPDPVVIHDTITVHDTVRIFVHSKPKYVIKHDTVMLPMVANPCDSTDSLCDGSVTDSALVAIPITQYEYRDTFATDSSRVELGITYEGYNAKIKGIDLNAEYTRHLEPIVVEPERGFGHFAGVSTGPCATVSVNPITGQLQWGIGWSVQLSVYGWGLHYKTKSK